MTGRGLLKDGVVLKAPSLSTARVCRSAPDLCSLFSKTSMTPRYAFPEDTNVAWCRPPVWGSCIPYVYEHTKMRRYLRQHPQASDMTTQISPVKASQKITQI